MKVVYAVGFIGVAALSARATVPVYGQCGGLSWTGETDCVDGATCAYQNDYYSQCVAGSATTTAQATTTKTSTTTKPTTTTKASSTTTAKPTTVTAAPTGAYTTTLPASSGYSSLATPMTISAGQVFDGKMVKYDRKGSDGVCQGQTETGADEAVFIVQPGGTVQNVIIGKDQAEGIHCKGACTIKNVWWEDVCEDALTIEEQGASETSYVIGGGAFHAEDKIIQHNGAGTVSISGFYASDFGKLYRACGNCATSHERHVVIDNVCLAGGSSGVGINTNWGDTAKLSNVKISGGKPSAANVCCTYKGVAKGSEPSKIGCGDDYSACQYSESSVGTC